MLLARAHKASNPELEQFAVDARRPLKRILRAHLPDQRAHFRLDRRSPSPSTRFPTPIAAKAGPMPTYQRFGSNNHENRKDRRKPTIELNEGPAVVVRETSPALQLTPQDHQLMSERGILSLKPDLRLEWGGQDRHDETQPPDHSDSLGDSGAASTRIKFSVHTAGIRKPSHKQTSAPDRSPR